MARRAHHASSGRALPWVLVGLLVAAGAGAAAWFALATEVAPERPVPDVEWTVGRVRSVPVDGEASEEALQGAGDEVTEVIDGLYTTGFVDPDEWADGGFPSLGSYFAERAGQRVSRDKDDLTLGEDAANVDRVDPRRARLRLSFLTDPQAEPYAAVAVATFRARGRTTGGDGLDIVHRGRYVLRRLEQGWRIVGYDVEGSVETVRARGGADG